MAARAPRPDVAVIGGGIVGTALAADLAGRGARVLLAERAEIAAGASGRNSGVVWYPSDPVLGALYRDTLARYRTLADEVRAELPDGAPERTFGLDDRPAGILLLGTDGAWLQGRAAAIGAANPEFRPAFLDAAALRRLEPGLAGDLAAVRLDIGFPVAPAAAARAFAALARARGADVRMGVPATVVRDGRRAVGVSTADGLTEAGAVVVAAGPWSPELVDPSGAWRPILPFWGVIVELVLASSPRHVLEEADIDAAIDPDAVAPDAADESTGFSLVSVDGRTSLGSTFLPVQPDPRDFEERLRDKGARYLPAIAASSTRGLRACARPLALDGRPLVGPVPGIDGLFIAAGHGPWGISTGPASAAHVAALALGDRRPARPSYRCRDRLRPASANRGSRPPAEGLAPAVGVEQVERGDRPLLPRGRQPLAEPPSRRRRLGRSVVGVDHEDVRRGRVLTRLERHSHRGEPPTIDASIRRVAVHRRDSRRARPAPAGAWVTGGRGISRGRSGRSSRRG